MTKERQDLDIEVSKIRDAQELREIRIEQRREKKSRRHTTGPLELKIEREGRQPKMSSISQDYVYVNSAFVGSTNSVNQVPERTQIQLPVDTVYREQYCVCARWPITKKVLAIGVGLLLGAAVGLTISMTLGRDNSIDFPILRSRPD